MNLKKFKGDRYENYGRKYIFVDYDGSQEGKSNYSLGPSL